MIDDDTEVSEVTFTQMFDGYTKLLQDNPGKALYLGRTELAVMLDGKLLLALMSDDMASVSDLGHFDPRGWEEEERAAEILLSPTFVDIAHVNFYIERSYETYADIVSVRGITPIPQERWALLQGDLPTPKHVDMPPSLNHAIAVALEANDLTGAAQLISQCNEHDGECWSLYMDEGDYLPAGGLWLNHSEWLSGTRPNSSPLIVAHVLDFEGDLPGQQCEI